MVRHGLTTNRKRSASLKKKNLSSNLSRGAKGSSKRFFFFFLFLFYHSKFDWRLIF